MKLAGRTETHASKPGRGQSRREFLLAGVAAPPVLSGNYGGFRPANHCLLLMLSGGPGHLDTWDPKPQAPADVRGPFRPLATNVAGVYISEIFPRTARHASKYSIIRSVHHAGPALHEAGQELIQTGRWQADATAWPHIGCAAAWARGSGRRPAVAALLCGASPGGTCPGQGAGILGAECEPLVLDCGQDSQCLRSQVPLTAAQSSLARCVVSMSPPRESELRRYGASRFGADCLLARRLLESGATSVTVNMAEAVPGSPAWDAHGREPFPSPESYRRSAGPVFDTAFSTLLEDLSASGLLGETVVAVLSEFGRSPRLNKPGGRDHWPECWSVLLAGGPIHGGRILGASDDLGAYPADRPVTPAEVAATIYSAMGIPPGFRLPLVDGSPSELVEPGALPIAELLA